jgi:hypothetical protein
MLSLLQMFLKQRWNESGEPGELGESNESDEPSEADDVR